MQRSWIVALAALLAGLAAGLAHPPFGLLPGLLAYGAILRLGDGAPSRRAAFFRGWMAGLGYFAVGVWWVVEAFLVDAATYGWMAPFALVLLASGLALFWGAGLMLYRLAAPSGPLRVLVFAGALSLMEWLRGTLFTGFPWNLPGETWRAGSAPSQLAAFVGAYGLTWITLALAAAPALVFDPGSRRRRATVLAVTVVAAAGLYGAGAWRLDHAAPMAGPTPRLRIVQANIDQKDKWRPENLPQVFAAYVGLTTGPAAVRPDIVIWPEGALPAVIDDLLAADSPYAAGLAAALAPGQALLMGANRAEYGPGGKTLYFNSLIAFRRAPDGLRVTGVYDKHRLVPFGEYLPLGQAATKLGLRSLVHMPEDFSHGPAPAPISPQGLPPVQPLICYEALFPGFTSQAVRRGAARPSWIVNVSNDAWFGPTSGPLQHLNLASYRAIEEGLPIVRATPTGVSAVIDAHGRILPDGRLRLEVAGIIDADLPARLQPTLYSRFGEVAFACMLLVSVLILGATRRCGRESQRSLAKRRSRKITGRTHAERT